MNAGVDYRRFVGMRVVEHEPATPPARAGVIVDADRRRVLVRWDGGGADWRLWPTVDPELANLANVTVFK